MAPAAHTAPLTTAPSLVVCPMHDGTCGSNVPTTVHGDTVHVDACPSLIAQGWQGNAQGIYWLDAVLAGRLTPAPEPAQYVRHQDGLVAFAL